MIVKIENCSIYWFTVSLNQMGAIKYSNLIGTPNYM